MSEKEVKNPLHISPEYIHIDFSNRPTFGNKVARMCYLVLYSLFAAVWFYFIPFTSIYISYSVPMKYGGAFTAYTSLGFGEDDAAAAAADNVDPAAVVDPSSWSKSSTRKQVAEIIEKPFLAYLWVWSKI